MSANLDVNHGFDDETPDDISSLIQFDRYGFHGGKEYTNPDADARPPLKTIRNRELKWREMCSNWEWWVTRNHFKLRERCIKGIPDSMRCEAWQRLCNSPMVLIARPKMIAIASNPPKKQRNLKGFLGTLSRNTNSRSLPTVITTSPSFRVRRGKAEDRRRFLFRKLFGTTGKPDDSQLNEFNAESPAFSEESQFQSLRVQKHINSRPIYGSNERSMRDFVNSKPESNSDLFQCSQTGSNDDSVNRSNMPGPSTVSGSFQSFDFDSSGIMISAQTQSTYTTTVSVHETSPIGYTVASSDQTAVASSSGGYASLSTNSGTDSISIRNISHNPLPPGTSSRDSYESSLNSSVTSSFSMLWPPNSSSEFANVHEPGEFGDARATLVPNGDPDPVALFEHYCMQEGSHANCDQIRRDIDRQFPFHELFSSTEYHGQESLYTILKAYTIRHSDKGYCQGQAPLAAVLLMFMPEVDAFWTFNEVCERYLEAYYDDGLERVQIDGEILYALLKSSHTSIYKFLKKNNVDPILIMLEWFMCVYTRTLPWPAVLRVLDLFFCEGKIVLFKVAIFLLQQMFGTRALRKLCPGLDDILSRLRDVQSLIHSTDAFIHEVVRVDVSHQDIAREVVRQSQKWEKNKQKKES